MSKVVKGTKRQAAPGKKKQPIKEMEPEESVDQQEDFDGSDSQGEIEVVPKKQAGKKPAVGQNGTVKPARAVSGAKADSNGEETAKNGTKASRTSQRFSGIGKEGKSETGLIYVGHLPYGFVEEGLKEYFEQYGDVLRVKLMRSKKTARSKGYCFIEFKEPEVAKIAAQSMNGYLMYGRPLACQYIEQSSRHKHQLIRADRKFRFVPWQVIYRKALNKVG